MIEFIAFALTLFFAVTLRWEARDLIWGLWISSLCVGYAFIVKTIISGILYREKIIPLVVALVGGLALLAFFTFHFGMFHFVHSVFLSLFFPLIPMDRGNFPNIPVSIAICLKDYWPLVLANFLAKMPDFRFKPVAIRDVSQELRNPYSSVVKIHILIFVFAGMSAFHLSRFAMYPILLFFFFPWDMLKAKKKDGGA